MTARPSDWSALDLGSDPVPGDAEALSGEATHYSSVATTIEAQVARLRRIADGDDTLKGDYAEALRESCDELAGDLEKAHGRFDTVGEELGTLVTPLTTALSTTLSALRSAESAREDMRQAEAAGYSPGTDLLGTGTRGADGEEDPALAAAKRKYENAETALGSAQARCRDAVSTWEGVAGPAASRIRDASDDDLKDGRFEGFKAWVKANAGWLKELSKWLGRIVLVLAIAILILSNPAGWIIALAVLGSIALLAVDTMLAVAGEGSWGDVALDVLGVVTLGAGSLIGKLAKAGRSMTLFRAGNQQGVRAGMQTLRNAFNNPGLRGAFTNVRNVFRPSSYTNALSDGWRVARHIRQTPLVTAPLSGRSLVFGRDFATYADDLADITATFGDDVVTGLHRTGVSGLRVVGGVETVNTAVDNLMDEGVPGFRRLGDLMDRHTTREVGSL